MLLLFLLLLKNVKKNSFLFWRKLYLWNYSWQSSAQYHFHSTAFFPLVALERIHPHLFPKQNYRLLLTIGGTTTIYFLHRTTFFCFLLINSHSNISSTSTSTIRYMTTAPRTTTSINLTKAAGGGAAAPTLGARGLVLPATQAGAPGLDQNFRFLTGIRTLMEKPPSLTVEDIGSMTTTVTPGMPMPMIGTTVGTTTTTACKLLSLHLNSNPISRTINERQRNSQSWILSVGRSRNWGALVWWVSIFEKILFEISLSETWLLMRKHFHYNLL